jgi:hypothetical protein
MSMAVGKKKNKYFFQESMSFFFQNQRMKGDREVVCAPISTERPFFERTKTSFFHRKLCCCSFRESQEAISGLLGRRRKTLNFTKKHLFFFFQRPMLFSCCRRRTVDHVVSSSCAASWKKGRGIGALQQLSQKRLHGHVKSQQRRVIHRSWV